MGRYILNRLWRSLISLVIVFIAVVLLVYSLMDRNAILLKIQVILINLEMKLLTINMENGNHMVTLIKLKCLIIVQLLIQVEKIILII